MTRLPILAAVLMIIASGAGAQGRGGPPEVQPIPVVQKETWIYKYPDKWYPFSRQTENKVETYVFPAGQNPGKWKEGLQYQELLTTAGVTKASQVFEITRQNDQAACSEYSANLLKDQAENGYSMSQWTARCVSADKSVLVTVNKVIVGKEKLYIGKKIWKFEPKQSELERWTNYLDQTYVCAPTNSCAPPHGRGGGREGGRGNGRG